MYYYDQFGNLQIGAPLSVGYSEVPVGATVVDRRSGSGGGVISTRPRRTVRRTASPGRVTITPGGTAPAGYTRNPLTGAIERARLTPAMPPQSVPGMVTTMPYFGDDAGELALIEQLRLEEAQLHEAQKRAELEEQIKHLREEKVNVTLRGVSGLSGSAPSMVHGSVIYPTEFPMKADAVPASGSTQIRYQVGRAIRIYRFLALTQETKDNFVVTGFRNNDREMREGYAGGGGVEAAYFDQADEKLITSFPWINENRRFDVLITNTDSVNPHDARFLVAALESEVPPEQLDSRTAESIERFLRTLVLA